MNKIQLIEMPSEICAGTRGASLGVDAMKIASLKANSDFFDKYKSICLPTENELLWKEIDTPYAIRIEGLVKIYERLCNSVHNTLKENKFPIVLSGDHASAGGTIAGIKKAYPDKRLGVIWIDAHADIHSPYTTPSGNVHGMPVLTAIGDDNLDRKKNDVTGKTKELWEKLKNMGGISPKILPSDLIYFGVRDTEDPENYYLQKHNIKKITVAETRKKNIVEAAKEALELLVNVDIIYISFDVDSMDCDIVSHGTGTPVKDGFTPEEIKNLITTLFQSEKLCCFEVVEINPLLDEKQNKMAETAFDILENVTATLENKLKP